MFVILDMRLHLHNSLLCCDFWVSNKYPSSGNNPRLIGMTDMNLVFYNQPGIAVQATIHIKIQDLKWLWTGNWVIHIIQANCDYILFPKKNMVRNINHNRQIPAMVFRYLIPVNPNLRIVHRCFKFNQQLLSFQAIRHLEGLPVPTDALPLVIHNQWFYVCGMRQTN